MQQQTGTSHHFTIGGVWGHIVRRTTHFFIAVVPIIYYYFGPSIYTHTNVSPQKWTLVIFSLVTFFEIVRLRRGWVLFGQRNHEAVQPSSFFWASLGVTATLLLAPSAQTAIPIIWTCAFIDPLVGEMRHLKVPRWIVIVLGLLSTMLIWWIATWWLGTTWWLAFVMAPIALLAEWPNWRWLDDNVLIQVLPLGVVLILYAMELI